VLLLTWRTWTEVTAPARHALLWLGTLSCSAHLRNCPLALWLRPHLDHAGQWAARMTVPLAARSWYIVEQPLQARPRPVAMAT
jgi:hypothetical protein